MEIGGLSELHEIQDNANHQAHVSLTCESLTHESPINQLTI